MAMAAGVSVFQVSVFRILMFRVPVLRVPVIRVLVIRVLILGIPVSVTIYIPRRYEFKLFEYLNSNYFKTFSEFVLPILLPNIY